MASPDVRTEALIIAKRGKGVDYQVKEWSPPLANWDEVRTYYPGMTWSEIVGVSLPQPYTYDIEVELDVYDDVDEYHWYR